MSVSYEIHPSNKVLVYIATGLLSADQVIGAMAAVAKDADYDPGFSVVMVTDDQVQLEELDYERLREITLAGVDMLGRDTIEGPSYQAIVCPDGMPNIFANLFLTAVESNPRARAKHKICKTIAETEQWTGCSLAGIEVIECAVRGEYDRMRENYG
ncbi:MAG: hypothetical protein QF521_17035 [Alphaproteobacteria bacterium]|jgi:hypothetical protein|nr:hypothetical protein [Alphaproteobacteria bacterium]